MHLCRLHEDGEQGRRGETALQSGGKGWDFAGTGCQGGAGRAVRAGRLQLGAPVHGAEPGLAGSPQPGALSACSSTSRRGLQQ